MNTLDTNPPKMKLSGQADARGRVRWGAGVLCFLLLGFFVHHKVVSPMSEQRAQALLEKQFVPDLLNGVAPVGYPIAHGTAVALLEIDELDLRKVVIEGSQAHDLAKGPGHLVGSALPGQPGTSAILGRSSSFGSSFSRLDELEAGQKIMLTTAQGVHTYSVIDSSVRSSTDAAAFIGERNMLLLITGVGGTSPDQRLVVRALLTSPVFPTGTAVLDNQTSVSELGLEGSDSSPRQLALWLIALLVIALALNPVVDRVGKRVTWLIACPVVLVVLLQVWRNASLMYPGIG